MADYYTQYSAEIDKLTDDEIKWLEARLKDIEDARADDDGAGIWACSSVTTPSTTRSPAWKATPTRSGHAKATDATAKFADGVANSEGSR